jgi:hypothetical protein
LRIWPRNARAGAAQSSNCICEPKDRVAPLQGHRDERRDVREHPRPLLVGENRERREQSVRRGVFGPRRSANSGTRCCRIRCCLGRVRIASDARFTSSERRIRTHNPLVLGSSPSGPTSVWMGRWRVDLLPIRCRTGQSPGDRARRSLALPMQSLVDTVADRDRVRGPPALPGSTKGGSIVRHTHWVVSGSVLLAALGACASRHAAESTEFDRVLRVMPTATFVESIAAETAESIDGGGLRLRAGFVENRAVVLRAVRRHGRHLRSWRRARADALRRDRARVERPASGCGSRAVRRTARQSPRVVRCRVIARLNCGSSCIPKASRRTRTERILRIGRVTSATPRRCGSRSSGHARCSQPRRHPRARMECRSSSALDPVTAARAWCRCAGPPAGFACRWRSRSAQGRRRRRRGSVRPAGRLATRVLDDPRLRRSVGDRCCSSGGDRRGGSRHHLGEAARAWSRSRHLGEARLLPRRHAPGVHRATVGRRHVGVRRAAQAHDVGIRRAASSRRARRAKRRSIARCRRAWGRRLAATSCSLGRVRDVVLENR